MERLDKRRDMESNKTGGKYEGTYQWNTNHEGTELNSFSIWQTEQIS